MDRRRFVAGSLAMGTTGALVGKGAKATSLAYRVPAEEAPHEATFMQWPANLSVYGDQEFLEQAQKTIAEIASTIAEFEPVYLLADGDLHDAIRPALAGGVELWDVPTDDLWCRDAGPLFGMSEDGQKAVIGIQFNGWGNKQRHAHDGAIAHRVANRLGLPYLVTDLKGEPGGIEADGHGRLMAHESCWVNDNRNPGRSRAEIETALLEAYGAESMVWSTGVKGEDITDYHIDALARFTGPGRVLMNLPDRPDSRDPFHMAALETHDTLKAVGLEVDAIPDPIDRRGRSPEFVASYVNYYVCNGAVIAPKFGDRETDAIAVTALARHYPEREIVTLNADVLGELGGGIHCATQQMPAWSAEDQQDEPANDE